jgi:hypothetical protein
MRFIVGQAFNVLTIWCAYLGVFEGSAPAANFIYFYCWFAALVSALVLTVTPRRMQELADATTQPAWLNNASDIAIAVPLIMGGWWWCVAAHMLQWVTCSYLINLREERKKALA